MIQILISNPWTTQKEKYTILGYIQPMTGKLEVSSRFESFNEIQKFFLLGSKELGIKFLEYKESDK